MVRKKKSNGTNVTNKRKGAKTGPKPGYKGQETDERVYRLCLLGLNDQQIAVALGYSIQTIEGWKRDYPGFRTAMQRGKVEADGKVVTALYEKACGYSHPDTHISSSYNRETKETEIIKTDIVKHYPPDTSAAIFWLTNRQRDQWQYTTSINHGGKVKLEHTDIPTDLSDYTDEELEVLKKMTGMDKLLNIKPGQLQ